MLKLTPSRAAVGARSLLFGVPAAAAPPGPPPPVPAAQGPPPPAAANGQPVKTLAHGVPTPTEFAFFKRTVFVGALGPEDGSGGGVYRIRKGKAKRIRS